MSIVTQWVNMATGSFNVRQIWNELNIASTEAKAQLRVYLNRLVDSGAIAKTNLDGTYRKVNEKKERIDWQNADITNNVPIQLPFGLHTLVKIYPKSIICVVGYKDQGKTAYLTDAVIQNMERFCVDFFNTESGKEQLKERFLPYDIPEPAPFEVWERYDNFADVIHPEHLSIIDYLDTNSEFYLVGDEIDKIFRKLTTGCAIIGLQKPMPSVTYVKGVKKVIDRDLAYGGTQTIKRATLYITLSFHKLKIVSAKIPMNKKLNPTNMMWSYDFDEDGRFTNIKRFYEDDNGLF